MGCLKPTPVGEVFHRLTVLRRAVARSKHNRQSFWYCLCECGKRAIISAAHVKNGHTRSCGCLHSEVTAKIGEALLTKHGHASHKRGRSRTFVTWTGMLQRCHNPKDPSYERYGARGISVCAEWRENFGIFLDEMGERPEGKTLDRINGELGYSKANCRWATPKEQAQHRRSPWPQRRLNESLRMNKIDPEVDHAHCL